MKNIDRIMQVVEKNGSKNIILHTIPNTQLWIICEKAEPDKWALTLCNPMGNIIYNLGMINDAQHLSLWNELINKEVQIRTNRMGITKMAKELRSIVRNFININTRSYAKFTKREEQEAKQNKILRSQRRRNILAHH